MASGSEQPEIPLHPAASGGTPTVRPLTVAEFAQRYGIKPHLVLRMIRSGQLGAINLRENLASKKPRWKIMPEDLVAFEDRRRARPAATPAPRRKRQPEAVAAAPVGRRW